MTSLSVIGAGLKNHRQHNTLQSYFSGVLDVRGGGWVQQRIVLETKIDWFGVGWGRTSEWVSCDVTLQKDYLGWIARVKHCINSHKSSLRYKFKQAKQLSFHKRVIRNFIPYLHVYQTLICINFSHLNVRFHKWRHNSYFVKKWLLVNDTVWNNLFNLLIFVLIMSLFGGSSLTKYQ